MQESHKNPLAGHSVMKKVQQHLLFRDHLVNCDVAIVMYIPITLHFYTSVDGQLALS